MRLVASLPRLVAGWSIAAAFANLLGLLVAALAGAGLVHLLAYHLPSGEPFSNRWDAAAGALVARCPWSIPLGVVAVVALAVLVVVLREVRRLRRMDALLARCLAARQLAAPPGEALPRSPWRLAGFVAAQFCAQVVLFNVIGALCPMPMSGMMAMHGLGTPASTPLSHLLSLAPVHALVALLLGLLLWRVERRLTRLRASVAARLRLLVTRDGAGTASPIPFAERLPSAWYALSLFARPPPRPSR